MKPEQQTLFRRQGYLYIRGALGKKIVQPVRAHILNELKRQGIWATGRTLSRQLRDVPVFQQTGRLGQLIRYPELERRLVPRDLYLLTGELAGASLTSGQDAQLLLSLPHQGDWTLKGLNWHRDIAHAKPGVIPGIQAFVLLDDLASHGGATLALAGSHKLRDQSQARQGLEKLISNADGSVVVDGVELSILEMAGSAGDIYLMDMRLLHTPSMNTTRNVRMMATMRYLVM